MAFELISFGCASCCARDMPMCAFDNCFPIKRWNCVVPTPFSVYPPPKKSLRELSRNHLMRLFVSSKAHLRNFLLIFPLSLLMSGLVRDEDKLRKLVGGKKIVVIGNIPKWNIAVLSGNQKVIFLSLAINFSTTCFRNPFRRGHTFRQCRKFCLKDIYLWNWL